MRRTTTRTSPVLPTAGYWRATIALGSLALLLLGACGGETPGPVGDAGSGTTGEPDEPEDDLAFQEITTDDLQTAFGGTPAQAECVNASLLSDGFDLSVFTNQDLSTDAAAAMVGAIDVCYVLRDLITPSFAVTYGDPDAARCVVDSLGDDDLREWAVLNGSRATRIDARQLITGAEHGCGAVALASAIPGPDDPATLSLMGCEITSSEVVGAVVISTDRFQAIGDLSEDPTDQQHPVTCTMIGELIDGTGVEVDVSTFHGDTQADVIETLRATAVDADGVDLDALPEGTFLAVNRAGDPPSVWVPDAEHPFGVLVTLDGSAEARLDVAVQLAELIVDGLP